MCSCQTQTNSGVELSKAIAFIPVAGMSLATIVAGNAVTNYSDVNTYLVTRALLPVPTAILEMWVYKDAHPPVLALLISGSAAVGFAGSPEAISFRSIPWIFFFMALMPLDALVLKHGVTRSNLPAWTLVYLKSALNFVPLLLYIGCFEVYSVESARGMLEAFEKPDALLTLFGTCLSTLGVVYFQMQLAYYISFTAFTILSIASKVLTVALNVIFIEYQGLDVMACVLLCILGAVLWQRSMQGKVVRVRDEAFAADQYPILQALLTLALMIFLGMIEHLNK